MNITAAIALPTEFIAGADVYYVPERPTHGGESGTEELVIELPVLKVTWDSLRETQRTILKAILNEGESLEAPKG